MSNHVPKTQQLISRIIIYNANQIHLCPHATITLPATSVNRSSYTILYKVFNFKFLSFSSGCTLSAYCKRISRDCFKSSIDRRYYLDFKNSLENISCNNWVCHYFARNRVNLVFNKLEQCSSHFWAFAAAWLSGYFCSVLSFFSAFSDYSSYSQLTTIIYRKFIHFHFFSLISDDLTVYEKNLFKNNL